jgi:hypothetical protein
MEFILFIIFAHVNHLKASGRGREVGRGGRGRQLDAVVVVDNNLQTSSRLPLIRELTFKKKVEIV